MNHPYRSIQKDYVQCVLRRDTATPGYYQQMTTWLPEKYALLAKFLKLKNKEGLWENHWQVISVGTRKPADYVLAQEREHLKHREVSDV